MKNKYLQKFTLCRKIPSSIVGHKFLILSIILLGIIFVGIVPLVNQKQLLPKYAMAANPNPIGPTGNWNMIFDDEFNNNSLNSSLWSPGWFGTGITGPVNSLESSCYSSTQVSEPGDGYLHLNLTFQASTCKGGSHPYTGSLVSSNPKDGITGHTGFNYTYGYVEWRVYLPPTTTGLVANWPATWGDGEGTWPATGENDTMEGLRGGLACFHFISPSGSPGNCASGNYGGWHTFGSDWEPGSVTYYYDGVQVGQIITGITSAPQFLIMDYTTSTSSISVAPATMLVDYVRVWQKCTTNCVSPSLSPTASPIPTQILPPTVTPVPTIIPTNSPTPIATETPTSTPTPTTTVCTGLSVTTPLTLNKTSLAYGQVISGNVTYTNNCQSSYAVKNLLIYAQSPNGIHYNFAPTSGAITLLPGQQKSITASLTIPNNSGTGQWAGLSSYQTTSGTWVFDSTHQKTFIVIK